MMWLLKDIWQVLEGRKTYVVGLAAVIWGLYTDNKETILIGLGLLGLRHGVSTEVKRLNKR